VSVEEPSPEALALLDLAPCGLVQTTDDGTFLRVNRMFCQWVGRSADALIGVRRFQDLLTMGGRLFHQTHWSPLLRMQGSVSEVKLEVQHANGSTLPMVLNAIRRQQGNVMVHDLAGYVARDRDRYERELVNARKRLESLVAEAQQLHAEARDRALFAEQMIGIVSHDLRNPLSAIMTGTALLSARGLSEPQQRTLGRITRSTERATALIADLLDFTQARLGGGISVTLAPCRLHDVIADALEELRLSYPDRELAHVRIGEGELRADGHRLGQVVGNLVSNAIAYGDKSRITVTSAVEATTATLMVHNLGVPIPEAIRSTLFAPMTRGAESASRTRSVGLGLYIVREIARAHGGDVDVVSTAAEGTTFRAVIPRTP
jgi:sigma-B regulation protein RsbU (phosphoserine phosphatase)